MVTKWGKLKCTLYFGVSLPFLKVAGLTSTQTDRWNIFGVRHFLMEANSILKVLKCLKSRKGCGFVSFCVDAFNY